MGGDLDGQRMEAWPWQRKFLRGGFRPGTSDSSLSIARGNGKSALVAAIATAVIDPAGPLHQRRAEVIVVASSFQQGRIVYEDILHFMRPRHLLDDRREWKVQDNQAMAVLEHRPSGARIRCIGSDPRRAHGARPLLALLDEPAQWEPGKSDSMLAAIRTGAGKVPGSRLIALGTRPAAGDHWFTRMLSGNTGYAQVHAARPDDPPFRLRTIRKANPSLEFLPSLKARVLDERDSAKRDPSRLHEWRALRLNQGVDDKAVSVLLDLDMFRRSERDTQPERAGAVWGIDLGQTQAMSAIAAYFPSGRLDSVAAWPRIPDLAARGLQDGVGRRYQEMFDRNELIICGERVSDVRALLAEALARFGRPVAIVADRWREGELRDALDSMRFPQAAFVTRGQGWFHGGEDVRSFRQAFGEDKVFPAPSLLMRSAVSEARTISDTAGNEKLAARSQGGRRYMAKDDAAAAAILAVAIGYRRWHAKTPAKQRRRLRTAIVR